MAPGVPLLPWERGQGPAPAAAARDGRGEAAPLQLNQGVANTHWGGPAQLGTQPVSEPAFVGTPLLPPASKSCVGCWEMLGCTRQPCCGEGL